ncbi:MAG: S-methyl-5'-thioadenosine phosphorylase [Candidatus Aenigmarchaeota archaeon CG_4_10_14_0_8_um_filter_37_24]|nr:S-methyl-5'-thioadenosine phosphorylase [Candidatus Aenigmarchaeota archaeon]OIN88129.1 MAG: methylthioadenosine phosphorylase [Candidatus Aenigmarchaeota archaeon CG1_02_38_14]PIV69546.1 MAG: S-methyl-5'-thioadenosine phosphorylase [Candidatus Aenigmarchaeota archaeon CG01_land_8_20_14_3_00_37_9]PIW41195.1 MAG: S-methyl-5'-thioadenosine phosphorylase [Candidatus Aenigmarchaeota archaeon CG15_BIG_FIL_POST_REV_8_21_14_020_37_27]PIX50981.1 MAG: S-methyl-5'-thioadenosine phosphorylase [Candidat
MSTEIGIIGGTGIYDAKLVNNLRKVKIDYPYGEASDFFYVGEFKNKKTVFLPRHGKTHTIPPHEINFKANISGFKELGVNRIIACCATGSLQKELKPGDIVIPDQFIDWRKRGVTFYDTGNVAHVSLADPFCPELRQLLIESCKSLGIKCHKKGTYVCIEGPRFSTRAESRMFRNLGDVIGMTGIPEAILAREKEICFAIIATVTDFDVWAETPVSTDGIVKVMKENTEKVRSILEETIPKIPEKRNCVCKDALKDAFV